MYSINPKFFKISKYQKKINDKISQCLTCERRCKISLGNSGFCQTRINKDGEIFTIVFGCIPALSFNPIEKKPLFHFYPGTIALTIGTYGCNFSCFWCQNHHISHPNPSVLDKVRKEKEFLSPEKFIDIALRNNCKGISISFNEPTLLFEYSVEVFRLAKKEGLYNTYVSNGYMTKNVLRDLVEAGLDAINIDIKGGGKMVQQYCDIDVEKVWRNAKLAKKLGVHVEITTLLIENLNSDNEVIEQIAKRILEDLGEFTPFHISRFFPHYKSYEYGIHNPTAIKSLKNAYEIAKNVGLKYVYLGNLPTTEYENTICPNCSKTVIKRVNFGIEEFLIDSEGKCKICGFPICRI
ncbi:MAG: AmmeMemoRadiSam system radical SAM enzyme [Promethearchaeota archaeon]|nr:MAG: AmmeMemoRadiSam system radical SAM enzyme [Candidatus Lokiarchaeota archaeon]